MNQEQRKAKALARFWKNVDVREANECWEWKGYRVHGNDYGRLYRDGKPTLAHRLSWELHFGTIPNGMLVCHHCDNPPCCNPSHLFVGTSADNMADKVAKGRSRWSKKKPKKEKIPDTQRERAAPKYATKLTIEQVQAIKLILALPPRQRPSIRDIARRFGVSHNTIWMISSNKTWADK